MLNVLTIGDVAISKRSLLVNGKVQMHLQMAEHYLSILLAEAGKRFCW